MKILIYTMSFVIFSSMISSAQNVTSHKQQFPEGLSFSYGYSYYSVKDQFISDEKYSGNANRFSLTWSQSHPKNGFRVGVDWLGSDEIRNNNIYTQINEFDLFLDYLYPIKRTSNPKKAYLFLG